MGTVLTSLKKKNIFIHVCIFMCGLVIGGDRAKFCLDGKYGYVNKKFEVVIPAIYTIANDFVNDKAFVVRDFPEGRKTTMIDENGNIFFNRWFDYIGEGDSNIVLEIDDRIIIYSKTKFEKIAEYYNGGYDHEDDYVPVFKIDGKDKFYGFIDSSGNITVPLIFLGYRILRYVIILIKHKLNCLILNCVY